MSVSIYRNESFIHVGAYYTDGESADDLVANVREKWALLREKNLAGDCSVDSVDLVLEGGPCSQQTIGDEDGVKYDTGGLMVTTHFFDGNRNEIEVAEHGCSPATSISRV